jgi:hypothetical protein
MSQKTRALAVAISGRQLFVAVLDPRRCYARPAALIIRRGGSLLQTWAASRSRRPPAFGSVFDSAAVLCRHSALDPSRARHFLIFSHNLGGWRSQIPAAPFHFPHRFPISAVLRRPPRSNRKKRGFLNTSFSTSGGLHGKGPPLCCRAAVQIAFH